MPVEKFGTLVDAGLLELVDPVGPLAGRVNFPSGAGDGAAAVESFDAVHHPRAVLHQGLIAAAQFLERAETVLAMVNRPQGIQPQQVGELVRIDGVVLGTRLQQGVAARITDHQAAHVRRQQVIEPAGGGAFFKGQM